MPELTKTESFYSDVLAALNQSKIPFLVGGYYGMRAYTGINRSTKDLDIFCRPNDVIQILDLMNQKGYMAHPLYPEWLSKIYSDNDYVDVIHRNRNGLCTVNDSWFEHAPTTIILEQQAQVVPVVEMIWSKSFVQARDCFHGIDIYRLIRAQGRTLDWQQLEGRMGVNWPVLLGHIINFGFVFPGHVDIIPRSLRDSLLKRQIELWDMPEASELVCRGQLFSFNNYDPESEVGYKLD